MLNCARAVIGVALVVSGWAEALAQPTRPDLTAKQVAPDVFMVQGLAEMGSSANQNFISNAGFVHHARRRGGH